mgnify:CR=1 FL=1
MLILARMQHEHGNKEWIEISIGDEIVCVGVVQVKGNRVRIGIHIAAPNRFDERANDVIVLVPRTVVPQQGAVTRRRNSFIRNRRTRFNHRRAGIEQRQCTPSITRCEPHNDVQGRRRQFDRRIQTQR